MNRIGFFAALFVAFVSVQACAQAVSSADPTLTRREQLANSTPEQRASLQTAQMKERLSLTADQETTVAAINLKYAQQMQSLIAGGERNRETLRQVRSLMNSKDDELKKVFDKDQYSKYEDFKDARKDRMKQARGRRGNR